MGRTSVATVRLPLPGLHNVSNALAAMGIAWSYGVPPPASKVALESFRPAERRLQTLVLGQYTVISDVAMNRGSYDAVMRTMEAIDQPLVVVTAIRGNRGAEPRS